MGKMNWGSIFLGGLLWAVVYNLVNAASWFLFLKKEWTAALDALGRPFQETPAFIAFFLFATLVAGITVLWLYAAIRPRYGPGPKTAAGAGFAFWVIGSLIPTIAWCWLLGFPTRLLVSDVAAVLVGSVVGTVVGAWPYKE